MEPLYHAEECHPPYELVEVESTGNRHIPAEYRDRVLIHTVHDGAYIPRQYIYDADGRPRLDTAVLAQRFIEERDWGANLVAHKIAAAMGVRGYARCRIARVLLDFNRFPGSTPEHAGVHPLDRLAINHPFATVLDHSEKVEVLERYYDRISDYIEAELLDEKLIMIAVHTYDEHNATKTKRPHLSLLTSMAGYQMHSRMPIGVFDPMYPDALGETTCSRILRDRVSLNLERNRMRVSHNHPYPLPEGCMEVRAQVWYFFDFLRRAFEEDHPETCHEPAFKLVWMMLLNTNLRLQEAEALRSYLHRYRKLPADQVERFNKARVAYEKLAAYVHANDIVNRFRLSPSRPSSLGLEVRKDLVCTFDRNGRPQPATPAQEEKATLIGNVVADAICTYFETDRQFL